MVERILVNEWCSSCGNDFEAYIAPNEVDKKPLAVCPYCGEIQRLCSLCVDCDYSCLEE